MLAVIVSSSVVLALYTACVFKTGPFYPVRVLKHRKFSRVCTDSEFEVQVQITLGQRLFFSSLYQLIYPVLTQ